MIGEAVRNEVDLTHGIMSLTSNKFSKCVTVTRKTYRVRLSGGLAGYLVVRHYSSTHRGCYCDSTLHREVLGGSEAVLITRSTESTGFSCLFFGEYNFGWMIFMSVKQCLTTICSC